MSLWRMFPFCLDRVALMSVSRGSNELDLKYCRQQPAIQCRDEMRLAAVVVEQQVLEPAKHG
ncbi:hypothetical protein GFL91_09075 [Rhizobium leguminosarum bv. viciae]|uniref:Uncharacterized protein n=1 Tax=Rhizobium leguminosarum bv. viciae TaxID=387 RepID=A0A8I2KG69_RHILV|nr:hypothetical protein [Rhizobium leguminosarum bv. viciae]